MGLDKGMLHHDAEHDGSIALVDASAKPRPLVLVAEPDSERRATFAEVLQAAGYAVASIADPSQAAAETARIMPALIIVRMGDAADGFSLFRELRGVPDTRDIPVLVLMQFDDQFIREQIVRAGATAILIEPLRRTLLLRQVRRLLARGARTVNRGAWTAARAH
jgi:two-component system, OmpR family, phosphate regulon response regulator PhoB